jgi:hypothetical protein
VTALHIASEEEYFVVEQWYKWALFFQLRFQLCWSGVGGDD